MKKVYPIGLSALVILSGCSSMNGRFSSYMSERFAALRHAGDPVVYTPANSNPKTKIVNGTHIMETTTVVELPSTPAVTPKPAVQVPLAPLPEPTAMGGAEEQSTPDTERHVRAPAVVTPIVPVPPSPPVASAPTPPAPAPAAPESPPTRVAELPSCTPNGLAPDVVDQAVPTGQMPSAKKAAPKVAKPAPAKPVSQTTASIRYLRNRRLRLDYEIRGPGSELAAVDLYYTRDGHTWAKAEALTQKPPYLIDFAEEGRFGITLVAHTPEGKGKTAPVDGDKPQAWVEIDLTKPDISIAEVRFDTGTRTMSVNWTATDKNLDPRSICISTATDPEGPWTPIARNVDNLGHYEWKVDSDDSQRVYVRVEASDLAGNVGSAQTDEPLAVESIQPAALITSLEEAP
jgi:hypothetical protein